jgi:anaerobic magnesium-protoporphyrin IX monomethyl ester cyclase
MPLRIALCYRCDDRHKGELYARLVPGGLLCLHGVLRRAGFDSRLFNFSGVTWPQVERRLARFAPRLVGVSHFTHNHAASMRLYAAVRTALPRALLVAGGEQVTYLDEAVLARAPALDVIVRGEGETALLDLARRLSERRRWQDATGLSYRADGGVVRNSAAPPVADLDDCYPVDRFEACEGVRPEEQFPFLVTSRGCPGRCTFCDTPGFWGTRLRWRSVRSVVAEIRHLMREHGLIYFGLRDDTFTARRDRVRELCSALTSETPGLLWSCQSRIDTLDSQTLLAMKLAGCEQIQIGVESLDPQAQKLLGKRVDRERLGRTLSLCRQIGIRTSAYLITGIPGQTDASLAPERELIAHGGLNDAIVSPLCYYPGTALFTRAAETGQASADIFLSGRDESLFVRCDREAGQLFRGLCRFIETHAPRNAFTASEIAGHLARTNRCVSSLLDWGRLRLAAGRTDEAHDAFMEVRQRWPRHPWGHVALAEWAECCGREQEARRWRGAAARAAREDTHSRKEKAR